MKDPQQERSARVSPETSAAPQSNQAPGRDEADAVLHDEPSPEVVALYLRPRKAAIAATVEPARAVPSTVAQADAVGSPDSSLIDSLTRLVTEMLQVHVRESVTAAVRALAPRLVVSLPPEGVGGEGDAQLRSRPARGARPLRASSEPE